MDKSSVSEADIVIRPYATPDRQAVRTICCDTAFMGQPMELFFDDREFLADFLTRYYTDYEPESSFVAEVRGEVVGYLIGCKDAIRKDHIISRSIRPRLIRSFIAKGLFFRKKTLTLAFHIFLSFLKGEFRHMKIPPEYPSCLHINVQEEYRRFGIGAKLMQAFFSYIRQHNIPGVNLSTFSETGRKFFLKAGFLLLAEGKTSQWRYLINRDVLTATFGKQA